MVCIHFKLNRWYTQIRQFCSMHPTVEKIKAAAEGLFFMSESDYPFEAIEIDTTSDELETRLKKLSGHDDDAVVEQQTLDYFLRNSVALRPTDTGEEQALAHRFLQLKGVLAENLGQVEAYRVGEVQVDIFIIGVLEEGKYAGLRTKSIET